MISLRVLLIHTYYPQFLAEFYRNDPDASSLPFEAQRRRLLDAGFAVADAYSHGLRGAGCVAEDLVLNADPLQQRWAVEHGLSPNGNLHDQRRQVLFAQVQEFQPDVLYVFEWCPAGDDFLESVKMHVGLLVGQVASPLRPERTYVAYDLMISSWPPLVDYFRAQGLAAEALRLAFDHRVLHNLSDRREHYDVTFVGGYAPSHTHRLAWLEKLCGALPVDVFGYGWDTVPVDSPVRRRLHGPVWGRDLYRTLRASQVTLNCHARIDVRGSVSTRFANNMRLYEATGAGTCLVTETRENLAELFRPGEEVVAFRDDEECIEQVRSLLDSEPRRAAVAHAGQQRTLRDHTYRTRMMELAELLGRYVRRARTLSRRC